MQRITRVRVACLLPIVAAAAAVLSISAPARADDLRLNQLQMIGTHNSYHIAPHPVTMEQIAARSSDLAQSLDYTHRPLALQLNDLGVRQIELDIFADPEGGHYANPHGAEHLPADVGEHDPGGVLQKPGFKVLHVPDVDFRTHALTFVDALQQIRGWSQAHPDHCPILILVEVKQGATHPELTQPLPLRSEDYDAIDREILSVFSPSEIIKPDDVRRGAPTLREAVLAEGWPLLSESRGKVIFAMDNEDESRAGYLQGHPVLEDRLLFVSVGADHAAAAFMKLNDPVGQGETIRRVVRQGFLVRTRADAGVREARDNDPRRREKAFASGAQYISTDYPEPDRRFSTYQARLPGNLIARGNPVTGPPGSVDREYDPYARDHASRRQP